jgi:hypothetical protein
MNLKNTLVPGLYQILRNDYLSITFAVTPLMLWVLWFAVDVLPSWLNGQKVWLGWQLLLALIGITGLCWLVVGWRVSLIHSILQDGGLVEGIITRVWFVQSRGQVECSYTYMRQAYQAKITLVKNERTSQMTVGEPLTLVVDPDDPKRVFVRDLFQ